MKRAGDNAELQEKENRGVKREKERPVAETKEEVEISGIPEEKKVLSKTQLEQSSRGDASMTKEFREFRVRLLNNNESLLTPSTMEKQQNNSNNHNKKLYSLQKIGSMLSTGGPSTKLPIKANTQTSLVDIFVDESGKKKGFRANGRLRDESIGSIKNTDMNVMLSSSGAGYTAQQTAMMMRSRIPRGGTILIGQKRAGGSCVMDKKEVGVMTKTEKDFMDLTRANRPVRKNESMGGIECFEARKRGVRQRIAAAFGGKKN